MLNFINSSIRKTENLNLVFIAKALMLLQPQTRYIRSYTVWFVFSMASGI